MYDWMSTTNTSSRNTEHLSIIIIGAHTSLAFITSMHDREQMVFTSRCPTAIFTISRNASVRGRTIDLITSTKVKNLANHTGVFSGMNFVANMDRLNEAEDIINVSHTTRDIVSTNKGCLDRAGVNGSNPNRFLERRTIPRHVA